MKARLHPLVGHLVYFRFLFCGFLLAFCKNFFYASILAAFCVLFAFGFDSIIYSMLPVFDLDKSRIVQAFQFFLEPELDVVAILFFSSIFFVSRFLKGFFSGNFEYYYQLALMLSINCLLAVLVCGVFKIIFGRSRPLLYQTYGGYNFQFFSLDNLYHSFPSGHAVFAGVFSVWIFYFLPTRKLCILIAVLLLVLALSRVLILQHYFSDVIAGYVIGGMISFLMARSFNFVTRRVINIKRLL